MQYHSYGHISYKHHLYYTKYTIAHSLHYLLNICTFHILPHIFYHVKESTNTILLQMLVYMRYYACTITRGVVYVILCIQYSIYTLVYVALNLQNMHNISTHIVLQTIEHIHAIPHIQCHIHDTTYIQCHKPMPFIQFQYTPAYTITHKYAIP